MRQKNLEGKRFGFLKVISSASAISWHCLCKCGTKKEAITADLTQGRVKSCGCIRNFVSVKEGMIFGRLKVVSFLGTIKNRKIKIYLR